MVFSSVVFLFIFLPIVYLLYTIMPSIRLKNFILIIASILFYAYGEPRAVVIMLISIFINYVLALLISKHKRRIYIAITVVFNVFLLVVFKYLNFFTDVLNSLFNTGIYIEKIHLPIGISFFTFQVMSYVIDVYRGDANVQKNIMKLALYVSFFPQLIAGPIIKYHDIDKQLSNRTISVDKAALGLKIFIFGLSSKLLIANTMGNIADSVFSYESNELYPLLSWIGAAAYALQIYFDFSGYSNMAIGLGKMFGFDFMENFNLPYISKGIKEFWQRWHISLSTWFKEYVYIPLGGNRKGSKRTAVNQLIVFALTGLWHGANYTFIVWGFIHGIFVVIESRFKNEFKKMPSVLAHIYTMFIVIITFVIFRADTIEKGVYYIYSMFFVGSRANMSRAVELLNPFNITIFVVGIALAFGLHKKIRDMLNYKAAAVGGYVLSILLFVLCIINISAATYNPFIYFRF